MVPYPRHSSIDSALRSKRPVNRTGPLLHRGFGADRKALPIFLVFHPLAARLASRSNVLPRHSDSLSVLRIPGGTRPDNSDERDQFRIHWICNVNTSKYKDNDERISIGIVLHFVIYNYINRYLLKYIYLQKAFSEQLHGIRGSSRDNRLLHILLILTLHKSRFGTLSKNSS